MSDQIKPGDICRTSSSALVAVLEIEARVEFLEDHRQGYPPGMLGRCKLSELCKQNEVGLIQCEKCAATLAVSLGRSVMIGAVILYGKLRLECLKCHWATWFYPAPPEKPPMAAGVDRLT